MNANDREILEFCLDEFRPLKPLTRSIPSGTLYHYAHRLVRFGVRRKIIEFFRELIPDVANQ